MSDEVETMFYVREVPWHHKGLGLKSYPDSSEEALVAAGLNWDVMQCPTQFILDGRPIDIPNRFANIRSTDHKLLGVVGGTYSVVQNREAFKFADELLGEGVVYETAGSLWGGSRVWLLAKLPERYLALGDDIAPYFCLTNSHDGFSGITGAVTPVRVVCQNTLNIALQNAQRTWSVRHTGEVMGRLTEARKALKIVHHYYETFTEEADRLANIKVDFEEVVGELFEIPEGAGNIKIKNTMARRTKLLELLEAPDIERFRGTAWGFINGVSDMVGHTGRTKNIEAWRQAQLAKAFLGYDTLNRAYALVRQAA